MRPTSGSRAPKVRRPSPSSSAKAGMRPMSSPVPGPTVGVEELPAEYVVLLRGDERAAVRGGHGEQAGPHAGPAGRLDLRRDRGPAPRVEPGEVDPPPGRPGRREAAAPASDGVVRH